MTLEIIHIDDLRVNRAERQRQESLKYKDAEDLADSINRVGLIHAPVVDKNYNLIAGERRVRAIELMLVNGVETYRYGTITDLKTTEVPVNVVSYADDNLIFEIELEENLRRINLTPMEEAKAIAKLHGVRVDARPEQTFQDTAQEVAGIEGRTPTSQDPVRVADSIIVSEFQDDPEVLKAAKQSLAKAAKVARKKMELSLVQAIARLEDENTDELFTVIHGDLCEVLPDLAPASFDILLFDPPYGIGADKFGDQAMDLGHQYKDDPEQALHLIDVIIAQTQSILKPEAHVLMFCAYELFQTWRRKWNDGGFKVWPRPIIWSKGTGHVPVPDQGPRYSYECILFATRGQRKITRTIDDVLSVHPPRDKIHAAEKPAELLEILIEFVGQPGARILDPCCGSGSIFTGAKGKEVYVTGIEQDEGYYAIAKERAK